MLKNISTWLWHVQKCQELAWKLQMYVYKSHLSQPYLIAPRLGRYWKIHPLRPRDFPWPWVLHPSTLGSPNITVNWLLCIFIFSSAVASRHFFHASASAGETATFVVRLMMSWRLLRLISWWWFSFSTFISELYKSYLSSTFASPALSRTEYYIKFDN